MTEQMTEQNCLKAAAQVNFQLVFMDIYMENMDGMGMPKSSRRRWLTAVLSQHRTYRSVYGAFN
ncbi:hypothetical protein, partial [Clostridium sp. MCC328]|uniref:hypothetical protein n=1 Tax=Clostridium sp. MCC328 TaxID=2592642 RepID=UPI001C027AF2